MLFGSGLAFYYFQGRLLVSRRIQCARITLPSLHTQPTYDTSQAHMRHHKLRVRFLSNFSEFSTSNRRDLVGAMEALYGVEMDKPAA